MKKYTKYKQTNISWIGNIPDYWKIKNIKFIGKTIAGGTPSTGNEEYWENGNIPWLPSGKVQNNVLTTKDITDHITLKGLTESAAKLIKPESILVALTGATCSNIALLTFESTANQSVIAIENMKSILPKYLFYLLLSQREQILYYRNGGAQSGVNEENIKNLLLVLPEIDEQESIVNFLDRKTEKIDKLIEQKERLIELLQEERVSIINQKVTKGINPDVKMKDSGIEWLGEIPEHWNLKPFKYNTYIKGRIGWQGLKQEEFTNEGPYLITGMNFKDGKINWEAVYHITEERFNEAPEIHLKEGDVLFTKDGTIGKLLYIDYLPDKTTLNSHLLLLRPLKEDYCSKYLYYFLQSRYFFHFVELHKTGTTFYGITQESMENFPMLLPPFAEQIIIINFIEDRLIHLDNTISKIEKEIELLHEYREALISEAVTGKIDVRGEL